MSSVDRLSPVGLAHPPASSQTWMFKCRCVPGQNLDWYNKSNQRMRLGDVSNSTSGDIRSLAQLITSLSWVSLETQHSSQLYAQSDVYWNCSNTSSLQTWSRTSSWLHVKSSHIIKSNICQRIQKVRPTLYNRDAFLETPNICGDDEWFSHIISAVIEQLSYMWREPMAMHLVWLVAQSSGPNPCNQL